MAPDGSAFKIRSKHTGVTGQTVRYGNQYEVLSFDELIEVDADQAGVEVRLRNLEYDLTRAIKKVSQGFQTIEKVFGNLQKTRDVDRLQMLKYYGATIDDSFLLDRQNARFPVPVQERKGMFMVRRIKMMDYPFFPDIRSDGFSKGHLALSGLQNVVMNWASPLQIAENLKDIDAEVLLSSSDKSWQYSDTKILPESLEEADTAFQPEGKQKSYPVAATFTGRIPSYFSDKPSPLFGPADSEDETDAEESKAEKDRTGRTLKESTPEARLAVVSSSAFVSDLVSNFGSQIGGGLYRGNAQFLRNLVDWSLADTDLLQIRTSGSLARTLKPMEDDQRSIWEIGNYAFALAALLIVVIVASTRRRRAKPIISVEAKS